VPSHGAQEIVRYLPFKADPKFLSEKDEQFALNA
jgi:hypothetical protein